MPEARCAGRSRPAPPSASSAAASSAACWRWPPRGSASRRTSTARRAARPSTWRRAPPRPASTTRRRSPPSPARSMSSPTSSRTWPSTTARHLAAPRAGAARRQGAGGGAGPAGREAVHRRARHPGRPVPRRRRAATSSPPRSPRSAAPAILKTRRLGYDGKGQASVAPGEDAAAAWERIGAQPAVLESASPSRCELSALVVRGADGEIAFYDCPRNTHEDGILRRSVVPSGLPAADLARARDIAGDDRRRARLRRRAGGRDVLLGADAPAAEPLMVNEIAPRVHNSGHWTIEACAVSQFENHMRAVAGWPLGSTARHSRRRDGRT